jgi:hypothetical protein
MMFRKLIKWFKGPTPAEAYEDGRRVAREEIAKAEDKSREADHLWHMASGGFNETESHREFDRGVQDQLHEIGYQAPYQNGQF